MTDSLDSNQIYDWLLLWLSSVRAPWANLVVLGIAVQLHLRATCICVGKEQRIVFALKIFLPISARTNFSCQIFNPPTELKTQERNIVQEIVRKATLPSNSSTINIVLIFTVSCGVKEGVFWIWRERKLTNHTCRQEL